MRLASEVDLVVSVHRRLQDMLRFSWTELFSMSRPEMKHFDGNKLPTEEQLLSASEGWSRSIPNVSWNPRSFLISLLKDLWACGPPKGHCIRWVQCRDKKRDYEIFLYFILWRIWKSLGLRVNGRGTLCSEVYAILWRINRRGVEAVTFRSICKVQKQMAQLKERGVASHHAQLSNEKVNWHDFKLH